LLVSRFATLAVALASEAASVATSTLREFCMAKRSRCRCHGACRLCDQTLLARLAMFLYRHLLTGRCQSSAETLLLRILFYSK
jgi:hypothetical protein